MRGVLVVAGTLSLLLGIIGIAVPLLPTTPFLLLSAACYAHSSGKFYHWLVTNRHFGRYISDYRNRKGIPAKVRFWSIAFLWTSILVSIFFIPRWYIAVILIVIAAAVTVHVVSIKKRD